MSSFDGPANADKPTPRFHTTLPVDAQDFTTKVTLAVRVKLPEIAALTGLEFVSASVKVISASVEQHATSVLFSVKRIIGAEYTSLCVVRCMIHNSDRLELNYVLPV